MNPEGFERHLVLVKKIHIPPINSPCNDIDSLLSQLDCLDHFRDVEIYSTKVGQLISSASHLPNVDEQQVSASPSKSPRSRLHLRLPHLNISNATCRCLMSPSPWLQFSRLSGERLVPFLTSNVSLFSYPSPRHIYAASSPQAPPTLLLLLLRRRPDLRSGLRLDVSFCCFVYCLHFLSTTSFTSIIFRSRPHIHHRAARQQQLLALSFAHDAITYSCLDLRGGVILRHRASTDCACLHWQCSWSPVHCGHIEQHFA